MPFDISIISCESKICSFLYCKNYMQFESPGMYIRFLSTENQPQKALHILKCYKKWRDLNEWQKNTVLHPYDNDVHSHQRSRRNEGRARGVPRCVYLDICNQMWVYFHFYARFIQVTYKGLHSVYPFWLQGRKENLVRIKITVLKISSS